MIPSVFDYTDYRKYLADYYAAKKQENPTVSYNSLSIRAGFKNKGFLYNVMHGKKNLAKSSIVMISSALGHKKGEAEYFENLVFFNQAQDLKERNYFFEKVSAVRAGGGGKVTVQELRKDQYDFYSNWHHSAIRSLIGMHHIKDDYAWLAKNVYPRISLKQARKSVELLSKLGLIAKDHQGFYKLSNQDITTGQEVVSLAVLNFNKQAGELALRALEDLPKNKRNITGVTMGISQKTYDKICEEISDFRKRIVEMASEDKEADRVFQMNLQLFPMSSTNIKNGIELKR